MAKKSKLKGDIGTAIISFLGFSMIYFMGRAPWYSDTEFEGLSGIGLLGLFLLLIWMILFFGGEVRESSKNKQPRKFRNSKKGIRGGRG